MSRRGIDPVIFSCVLGLMAFGIVMIYSTSHILSLDRYGDQYHFVKRHITWAAIGVVSMLLVARANIQRFRSLAFPVFVLSATGLLMVFIPEIGREAGGARRWITLGSMSIQPAEFAKFGLVFFLAHFLSIKSERLKDLKYGFLPSVMFTSLLIVLVLAQPDLGTAILIAAVAGMMLFLAGARWQHLAGCAFLTSPVLYWMVFAVPWRKQRVLAFLDPFHSAQTTGYQLVQSLVGMARGGFLGTGLGEGKQKLFYLPEAHTDFIYAVVGEELGLIGGLTVAAAFAVILYRGLSVASDCQDSFDSLLAAGVTLLITLQGLINMSVASGLIPTTGVPLPLVSLGGSSLVMSLTAFGVLLSIASGRGAGKATRKNSDDAKSKSGQWLRFAWSSGGGR